MKSKQSQWFFDYERRRTEGEGEIEGKGNLHSTRFELEGLSWDEIREIPVPQLGIDMTFGKSYEALRKSRYALRESRKDGKYSTRDLEFRINRIQYFLGIDMTEFDDLDINWVKSELAREEQEFESNDEIGESEEMTVEEMELKAEERVEELTAWGLDEEEEGEEQEDNDPW